MTPNAWSNPQPTAGGEPTIAPIADLSYRNYDGPLKSRTFRWWIVALSTIRGNVNRNRLGFWLPVGIVFLTYLVRAIYFYFHQTINANLAERGIPLPDDYARPFAASLYNSMSLGFTSLMVFIATLVVGSSSIAADNRANALLVYLSKPLSRVDYLLGKWMGVFLLLAGVILGPSLLMYLFFLGAYYSDGFLKNDPTLILRVLVAGAIPALLHASLIVGFSAWSKSGRVTGAIYAAFYLILNSLTLTFGSILYFSDKSGTKTVQTSMILHSSIDGVADGLAQHVYDVPPPSFGGRIFGGRRHGRRPDRPLVEMPRKTPDSPPLWYVLLLAGGYVVLPLSAAAVKIRAVEVVRG